MCVHTLFNVLHCQTRNGFHRNSCLFYPETHRPATQPAFLWDHHLPLTLHSCRLILKATSNPHPHTCITTSLVPSLISSSPSLFPPCLHHLYPLLGCDGCLLSTADGSPEEIFCHASSLCAQGLLCLSQGPWCCHVPWLLCNRLINPRVEAMLFIMVASCCHYLVYHFVNIGLSLTPLCI